MTKIRLTAFLMCAFVISSTAHAEDAEQTPNPPRSTDETKTTQHENVERVDQTSKAEGSAAEGSAKNEEANSSEAEAPVSPQASSSLETPNTRPTEKTKPLFDPKKLKLKPSFSVKAHRESVDSFDVHSDGAVYDREPEDFLQLRLGLKARYDFVKNVFVKFNYEHDLISRRIAGALAEGDAFVRTDRVTPKKQRYAS